MHTHTQTNIIEYGAQFNKKLFSVDLSWGKITVFHVGTHGTVHGSNNWLKQFFLHFFVTQILRYCTLMLYSFMLLNVAKQRFIIILDNMRKKSFNIKQCINSPKTFSCKWEHSGIPLTKKNCCCVEICLIPSQYFLWFIIIFKEIFFAFIRLFSFMSFIAREFSD